MSKGKIALISLVMWPVSMVINGLTLSVLWGWFIVTTFGLPELAIAQALGLYFVVGYFTFMIPKHKWENEDTDLQKITRIIGFPFFKMGMFLGFGWIIQLFI